ncbi:MAG: NAD(P)-dependent oxidoreductase, partial [Planctomycetia bacterium]|nr:NAD(P)-dependent oxidoreductase [Planctomycetia bacterium]
LVAAGADAVCSPRDAANASQLVITCLPDSPDVEKVALGPNGIIEGARDGLIYIDMSTISPAVTRKVGERLASRGVTMLDAPISGGDVGARDGTLSIMVGGPEPAFDLCRPVFECMGRTIVHVGPAGHGQLVKLCNQVICVLNILATAEGILLATSAGVNLEKMLQAVSAGAAGSWMLQNLGPKMVARDFAPGFMVRLQEKDLRLVLEAAEELDLPLPGTRLVAELFKAVDDAGDADFGTQALITAVEALAKPRGNTQP